VVIIPAVQEAYNSTICASESRAALPVVSRNPFPVCFLYCSTVIANDLYHNHTLKNSKFNEVSSDLTLFSSDGDFLFRSFGCQGIRSNVSLFTLRRAEMNCTALQDARIVPVFKERERSADGPGSVKLQIVTDDPLWLARTLNRAACVTRDFDHPSTPPACTIGHLLRCRDQFWLMSYRRGTRDFMA
jgi:hypothetical protein